jgi:energy-coupling factor transporter ATP-binding protein EcfA2
VISLRLVNARAGDFRLTDITFEVADGGYGVVIGPAGAGKTTLLETIAGVTRDVGADHPARRRRDQVGPERRRLGTSINTHICFLIDGSRDVGTARPALPTPTTQPTGLAWSRCTIDCRIAERRRTPTRRDRPCDRGQTRGCSTSR